MAEECCETAESTYTRKVIETVQNTTIPMLTHAYVSNICSDGNQIMITTNWSQNNFEINKSDKYSILYNFDHSGSQIYKVSFPLELYDVLIESVSPSREQRAVIKKHTNETTKKEEYIFELWSILQSKRIKTINLTSIDKHGQVHSDKLFGSLCWSGDETKIVYVAEKKKPKTPGFFEKMADSTDSGTNVQGGKYEYEESWGEQLTDVTNTVLCILNLCDDNLDIIDGIPENVCPLQPQFGPDNILVFAGFQKLPFRLGLQYCDNRECGIYLLKLKTGEFAIEITKSSEATLNYFPSLNKQKSKMVFQQYKLSRFGNPHMNCNSLMMYNFQDNLLKLVSNQFQYGDQIIPLFTNVIKNYNYWLADDSHIAIPNIYEGRNYVCIVDTESGELNSMIECSTIFSTYKNIVLASYQKLNSITSTLMIIDCDNPLKCIVTKESQKADNEIEYNSLVDKHGLTSYYLIPKKAFGSNDRFPLFVSPHGGPHSLHTNNYNRDARLFCKLGYAVLLVNYRGSYGFSEESLKSLPGNIGTQDVTDVQDIVHQFIDLKKDLIDKGNIFICGGSHGGFLGVHLIGQFPEFYCAAALRNPVIELCSMSITSDIIDWTYYESGLKYTQDVIPSVDTFRSMLEKSPILHVANIKAPLLLCIGEKDARVPPSQGKYLFKILKANKKVVKLLLYPNDCHPLSNVETEGNSVVHVCKWFYQHGSHSK